MITKEMLKSIWESMPDDVEVTEGQGEQEKTEPNTESAPETKEIEPSNVENVEVTAPPVDNDIIVVTPNDMVEQSIDMRLASFYKKQIELESAVKILLDEVTNIKEQFKTVESAIDTASRTSPTVESIGSLINML